MRQLWTNGGFRKFVSLLVAVILVISTSGSVFALKERAMVPPVSVSSKASVLNESWIQIYLKENAYNTSNVSHTAYYTITSSNDADFAGGVNPILVQSRYYPEEGPYCSVTYCENIASLNEIYRIFLQLPSNKVMKEGKSYTISIDSSVVSVSPLTAVYALNVADEAIHVNQVGYLSDGPKIAYMSFWTGQGSINFDSATTFELIDESTGSSVFSGPVHFDVAGANEKWGKSDLYSLDFSSFAGQGTYHLYVPTVGVSYSFEISSTVYEDKIGYSIIRGLTMQRDGNHGLNNSAVTHWTRPAAHLDDAIDEATGQRVDLVGGHMDAGDRGEYPYNVASFSASLLSAVTLFPDEVEALGETLEIPESGNGIPDFLDEAVYELDFLEKAVNNTAINGALAAFIHTSNDGYEQGYPPEGATGRVYFDVTYGPLKPETLYGAGALAMAYNTPLLQQYLPASKLDGYLQAAERAFNAFDANKNNAAYWNSYNDDYYDTGLHSWSDEMLVAAANLHHATGDVKYLNWITSELPSTPGAGQKRWGWDTQGPWLNAFLSLYKDTNLAAATRQAAYDAILDWADDTMKPEHQQPYGVPMVDSTYSSVGWYFSGSQISFPMMMAYEVSGDTIYRDQLIKTWNYLLGGGPLSRSYISGLGDPQKSPRWILHEISQYQWVQYNSGSPDGWSEMVPGIPNADLQQGSFPYYFNSDWNNARKYNESPTLSEYAPLYRYNESWNTMNEFSTYIIANQAASIIPLLSGGTPSQPPTSGYTVLDVGTNSNGSYSEANGVITLGVNSPYFIWNTDDTFRYAYQDNLSGDTTIIARVDSFTSSHGDAMAGVMIRQSTATNSNNYGLFLRNGGIVTAEYRNNGYEVSDYTSSGSAPKWLKLVKTGSIIDAYTSADGSTWTQVASRDMGTAISGSFTAGLAVASGSLNHNASANFSNITWPDGSATEPTPSQYTSVDIGTTSNGSTSEAGGAITVGVNSSYYIWSDNDAFRYAYQDNLSGDTTIIAKVANFTSSYGDSMAGIMIRQSTATNSNHFGVFLRNGGIVSAQDRNGTWTVNDYSGSGSAPKWLKLVKTGSIIDAYISDNGSTWTQVASKDMGTAISAPYTAGLAVTSGSLAYNASASFSNITWPN